MKKLITLILISSISILYLTSCDGGGGEGEGAFTIFDVTVRVLDIESTNPDSTIDCPETAYLKLSLSISDNSISGFAELLAFGHVGDSVPVSGSVQGNNFFLNPFNLSVDGDLISDPPIPCCVLILTLNNFEGVIVDNNEDGIIDGLGGDTSGEIFSSQGFTLECESGFTGEFEGEGRTPTGCLSIEEFTSVSEYWSCPAEAISSLCDGDGWFCGLPAPPPLAGDGYITNLCEAVDCHTIVNCELAPDITNLECSPGLCGNVILQDGSIGEPIYGCSSFSFGY